MRETSVGPERLIDDGLESSRESDDGWPAVLLVDDQLARLLACEAILANVPVRCVRALSGEEALARLLKQQFAAIVLDVSMPGMDGFETARLIRTHHRFQTTPIVFVTGVHLTELDCLKGYEAGAIDYLQIPIVPQILRAKIAILVELHQRRRDLEELTRALVVARSPPRPLQIADMPESPLKTPDSDSTDAERCKHLLGSVAHDLRNALAPIHYSIETLLSDIAATSPILPVLQMIKRQSLRISRLADDFDVKASRLV